MSTIIERIKNEPVVVTALVQSVVALVVSFGLPLSPEQIGGILAVTAALLAFVARAQVTPTRAIDGHAHEPVDSPDPEDYAWRDER